jgi:RNA polymerase-binding transcription factor DksA
MAASTSSKKPAARKSAPAAPSRPPAGKSAGKSAAKKATVASPKPAKQPAAKKSPASTNPAAAASAKSRPATKTPATKTPAKRSPSPKGAASKPAAAKSSSAASTSSAKQAAAATPPAPAATSRSATTKATTHPTVTTTDQLPKPKFNKEGLGYTKDFDLAFVKTQYELLQQERERLTGQALRLEDEAHQLVEEAEMGDVQYDEEGGEGDTMVVERERDLALSAQARDAVVEIDAAIARIMAGTYGYSVMSGRPIPIERLEAIPWSSVLVEEKVGGIGRS